MMSTFFFVHSKCKKRAEKLRKKRETEISRREKETKLQVLNIYMLRPRQGEDREEIQPGRKLGIGKVR